MRARQWFVIWPLADVVVRNRLARSLEGLGRQGLVGFGDDGTGANGPVKTHLYGVAAAG